MLLLKLMFVVAKDESLFFFFFSSRRRHTRCSRDWSSDVCSSDLAENGVDEPGPNGERQSGESHAWGVEIDGSDAEIERVEKRRGAKDGNADDPEGDGGARRNQERSRQAQERGNGGPKREKVQRGKSHFARADLQRQEIVSEPGLRRGGEHQENHQRTMECGESGKTVRRVAETGEKREMQSRPDQVDAHEQRHGHAKENAEEREPKIVQANGLVVGVEDVAGHEADPRRFPVVGSAGVVVGHARPGRNSELPEASLLPREQPSIDYILLGNSRAQGDGG